MSAVVKCDDNKAIVKVLLYEDDMHPLLSFQFPGLALLHLGIKHQEEEWF